MFQHVDMIIESTKSNTKLVIQYIMYHTGKWFKLTKHEKLNQPIFFPYGTPSVLFKHNTQHVVFKSNENSVR